MGIEEVRAFFTPLGMAEKILEFSSSTATVELAAAAVGCEPARIAKTLSFKKKDGDILIVTAGDARVDNRKYKDRFGVKAKFLTADEASERIGHGVGGVCPFAIKPGVTVYLDQSLKRFTTVFPACGSANSAIELTPDQLAEISASTDWVDVCTGWE